MGWVGWGWVTSCIGLVWVAFGYTPLPLEGGWGGQSAITSFAVKRFERLFLSRFGRCPAARIISHACSYFNIHSRRKSKHQITSDINTVIFYTRTNFSSHLHEKLPWFMVHLPCVHRDQGMGNSQYFAPSVRYPVVVAQQW